MATKSSAKRSAKNKATAASRENYKVNWREIARVALLSRALDLFEEQELYPKKKVIYQFSARGHELGQAILGSLLTHPKDAAGAYYRSRPLLLSLGLTVQEALSASVAKPGGFNDGRDIGAVCNLPSRGKAAVLPMAGDVGSQYTPVAGWAEAIQYHHYVLGDPAYAGAIGAVLGGEGSVATNGFWSALNIATTLSLPMLFFIEDNGFAISVPSDKQTPGGNIAANLRSFGNLHIIEGDGTDPQETWICVDEAVRFVRLGEAPALLRLTVPRLSGHSGQDTQHYKKKSMLDSERKNDPIEKLRKFLVDDVLSKAEWQTLELECREEVLSSWQEVERLPEPDADDLTRFVYSENVLKVDSDCLYSGSEGRINMLDGIRRTLQVELSNNPRVVVFGEDVGPKGGVHAATMGLQEVFGIERVFDTSLSEEGIIGRAVGMALSGLVPVAEIQFRKYADPATEQLNNCGTMRWRTKNRFAAPVVVRMPGGFSKVAGDPWHSVSGEVIFAHAIGWQVAMPSNAEDAVGLLRAALRSENPTIFFEHRALLDTNWARRPYPGDDYMVEFGKARIVRDGAALTIVSWGAMVERCNEAAEESGTDVELIDLRTIAPWDVEAVVSSLKKTKRCLIVHEDNMTAGFGAEISATISESCFEHLDAPVQRVATPDIPVPYNRTLMDSTIPSVSRIREAIENIMQF